MISPRPAVIWAARIPPASPSRKQGGLTQHKGVCSIRRVPPTTAPVPSKAASKTNQQLPGQQNRCKAANQRKERSRITERWKRQENNAKRPAKLVQPSPHKEKQKSTTTNPKIHTSKKSVEFKPAGQASSRFRPPAEANLHTPNADFSGFVEHVLTSQNFQAV